MRPPATCELQSIIRTLLPLCLMGAAVSWLQRTASAQASEVRQADSLQAERTTVSDSHLTAWRAQLNAAAVGESVLSAAGRTEYQRGDLNLIIAAPHGGRLKPRDLPDRTEGVLSADTNVDRLARAVCEAIAKELASKPTVERNSPSATNAQAETKTDSGRAPHLVLCHLHRRKLDANRPLDAACASGSPAEVHWHEYQLAIAQAKRSIVAAQGRGLFVEIHGHAHPIQRLELGYLLRSRDFDLSPERLNEFGPRSSLREIAARGQYDAEQLLRGTASLGHMLEQENFNSVPSPLQPSPGREPYFNGGWNTLQHGSRDQGTISSIQIECHYRGVRDTEQSIASTAASFSRALLSFLDLHYPMND